MVLGCEYLFEARQNIAKRIDYQRLTLVDNFHQVGVTHSAYYDG